LNNQQSPVKQPRPNQRGPNQLFQGIENIAKFNPSTMNTSRRGSSENIEHSSLMNANFQNTNNATNITGGPPNGQFSQNQQNVTSAVIGQRSIQRQISNPPSTSLPSFDPIWSNSPIFTAFNAAINNNASKSESQKPPPDLMSIDTKPRMMNNNHQNQMNNGPLTMQFQNNNPSVSSLFGPSSRQNSIGSGLIQKQNSEDEVGTNNLLAGLFGSMNAFANNNGQQTNFAGSFQSSNPRPLVPPPPQNQLNFMNTQFGNSG